MTLFISKPRMDSRIGNIDDWLDYLLVHEYTHILTIDRVDGFYQVLRYIFGRLFFINSSHPPWIIEGIAVQQESSQGKGRNNSTYVDMMMRLDFLSGNERSLNDISFYLYRDWILGSHYIYGGRFIQYLEQRYGDNSFTTIFREQARRVWPFQVDRNIQEVYGEGLSQLWSRWVADRKEHYRKERSRILEEPLTTYKLISDSGFSSGHSRFDPDGEKIYFIRSSDQTKPQLAVFSVHKLFSRPGFEDWEIKPEHIEILATTNRVRNLSVAGKGRIYISQLEVFRNYSSYNDIFLYSADAGYSKLRQLSRGLRAGYLDFHIPSQRMVFISEDAGTYSLVISGVPPDEDKNIMLYSERQLAYCRFSPSGNEIIFSFRDVSGFNQLAILDARSRAIIRLTDAQANHIQPSWHPSGQKVLFSSDKTGIYNVYELGIASQSVLRLTNVVGGLFAPDVSPDHKWITLTSYERNGFNPAIMPYPETDRSRATQITPSDLDQSYFRVGKKPPAQEYETKKFNPFLSMWPAFWALMPYGYFTSEPGSFWGIYTFGQDVLELNTFSLNIGNYLGESRLRIIFQYRYSGFWPDVLFTYFDNTIFYSEKNFKNILKEERLSQAILEMGRLGSLTLIFPFLYYQFQNRIFIDYTLTRSEKKRFRRFADTYSVKTFPRDLATIGLRYSYSDVDFYLRSISPESGRVIRVSSLIFQEPFDSPPEYYMLGLGYYEYLPSFSPNHVLLVSLRGRAYFGSNAFSPPTINGLGLRGYASGTLNRPYAFVLSIEYRFPIWQPDIGWYDHLPFVLKDIWIGIFFDLGQDWEHRFEVRGFRRSLGGQLNINWNNFYRLDLSFFARYEYGFDQNGESIFKFGFQTSSFGSFSKRSEEPGCRNERPLFHSFYEWC